MYVNLFIELKIYLLSNLFLLCLNYVFQVSFFSLFNLAYVLIISLEISGRKNANNFSAKMNPWKSFKRTRETVELSVHCLQD